MSKTIFKYPVYSHRTDGEIVSMPVGARPLFFQDQRGELCVWAEVDPDAEHIAMRFVVVGTGHPVPADMNYLGTALSSGGFLVWHCYYRQELQ